MSHATHSCLVYQVAVEQKKKHSLEHTTHIRDKCHARHMIRMLIIVSLSKTKKPYNTLPTYGINVPRNT